MTNSEKSPGESDCKKPRVATDRLELGHVIEITESFLQFVKQLNSFIQIIDKECESSDEISHLGSDIQHKSDNCSAQSPSLPTSTARAPSSPTVTTSGSENSVCVCESCNALMSSRNAPPVQKNDETLAKETGDSSKDGRKKGGKHVSTIIKALTSQFHHKSNASTSKK